MAEDTEQGFEEEVEEPDEPDELDVADLDELAVDEEDDSLIADDEDDAALEDDDLEEAPVVKATSKATATASADEEEDEDDDDEVLDPDDVEASLDVILKDRLVVDEEEGDEEEPDEVPDVEERTDGSPRVLPKRPDEFVCQSCFLVKHPSQLEDPVNMYCRDCV